MTDVKDGPVKKINNNIQNIDSKETRPKSKFLKKKPHGPVAIPPPLIWDDTKPRVIRSVFDEMVISLAHVKQYRELAKKHSGILEALTFLRILVATFITTLAGYSIVAGNEIMAGATFILAMITAVISLPKYHTDLKISTELVNKYENVADKFEVLWQQIINGELKDGQGKLDEKEILKQYDELFKKSRAMNPEASFELEDESFHDKLKEIIVDMRAKGFIANI